MKSLVIDLLDGRTLDLFNPDPNEIRIEEIANALSKICRFGGQCYHIYSVAQHSIASASTAYVATEDPELTLAVLMHDSAEAYCGDIITPIKRYLGDVYTDIEKSIETAIGKKFDIDFNKFKKEIKIYDNISYDKEKSFMKFGNTLDIASNPDVVARSFLYMFKGLKDELSAT